MSSFEFLFNTFQKFESSKRLIIILISLSLFYPAMSYIVFFDYNIFADNSFSKLIFLVIIINIQTLFALIKINILPVVLINFIQNKMMKKFKRKCSFLEKSNDYEDDKDSILRYSEFTVPFMLLCMSYIIVSTIVFGIPYITNGENTLSLFGKINLYSLLISLFFISIYISYSLGYYKGFKDEYYKGYIAGFVDSFNDHLELHDEQKQERNEI